MPRPEKIVKWECTIVASTEKAIRVRYEEESFWLPKSQLFNADDLPETGDACVELPEWLAEAKLSNE